MSNPCHFTLLRTYYNGAVLTLDSTVGFKLTQHQLPRKSDGTYKFMPTKQKPDIGLHRGAGVFRTWQQ